MSDLVPVSVTYDISFATGGKQSYSISGEVTVTEAVEIASIHNDNVYRVAEYFNRPGYA